MTTPYLFLLFANHSNKVKVKLQSKVEQKKREMAGEIDEARVPLLASQNSSQDELGELRDEFDVQYAIKDGRKAQVLGWTGSDLPSDGTTEVLAAGRNSSREGGGRGLKRVGSEQSNASRPRKKKQQYTGSEMIVAVFVVAFDTKKGQFCAFSLCLICGS